MNQKEQRKTGKVGAGQARYVKMFARMKTNKLLTLMKLQIRIETKKTMPEVCSLLTASFQRPNSFKNKNMQI